jgi:Mn-dependent DtxR family transcriptional regulator
MKCLTKDEKYLVTLYETAVATGDPYAEENQYAIGDKLGLNERTVTNIVKLLAQTNFLKKRGGDFIALTPHGENLVQRLLSQ